MKSLLAIFIICLCFVTLASAVNGTSENFTITAAETNVIKPLPEEFYGNAVYSDNSPILSGSVITVINQDDILIGNFTMVTNGSYGDMHASAKRLMVYGESIDDKMTFYIDDIKTTTIAREFDSAAIKRADLVIPAISKPTPTPTPEPTTPEVTPTPEPTTPEVTPTPVPTTIPTIVTTVPTPVPTPAPIINNTTIKFLGVLLISIAICVAGALITYFILTKKMKRDDEEDIIL